MTRPPQAGAGGRVTAVLSAAKDALQPHKAHVGVAADSGLLHSETFPRQSTSYPDYSPAAYYRRYCTPVSTLPGLAREAAANPRQKLMLWLGDHVYFREADYESPWGRNARYRQVRSLPELQPLLAALPHYAIWDDHDFGPNDTNRSFVFKDEGLLSLVRTDLLAVEFLAPRPSRQRGGQPFARAADAREPALLL